MVYRKISNVAEIDSLSGPNISKLFLNNIIPEVVVIGRSNVGKSTLINSLLGNQSCLLLNVYADMCVMQIGFQTHDQQAVVTPKPGETKSLHFYGLPLNHDEAQAIAHSELPPYALFVVDMPGYGFSYMNEHDLLRSKILCFEYLCRRGFYQKSNEAASGIGMRANSTEIDIKKVGSLKNVLLLLDARHGLKLADKLFFEELLKYYYENHSEKINKISIAGEYLFPWKIQIVLTKCDLVDRIELSRRIMMIHKEWETIQLSLIENEINLLKKPLCQVCISEDSNKGSEYSYIIPVSYASADTASGYADSTIEAKNFSSRFRGYRELQESISAVVPEHFIPVKKIIESGEESSSELLLDQEINNKFKLKDKTTSKYEVPIAAKAPLLGDASPKTKSLLQSINEARHRLKTENEVKSSHNTNKIVSASIEKSNAFDKSDSKANNAKVPTSNTIKSKISSKSSTKRTVKSDEQIKVNNAKLVNIGEAEKIVIKPKAGIRQEGKPPSKAGANNNKSSSTSKPSIPTTTKVHNNDASIVSNRRVRRAMQFNRVIPSTTTTTTNTAATTVVNNNHKLKRSVYKSNVIKSNSKSTATVTSTTATTTTESIPPKVKRTKSFSKNKQYRLQRKNIAKHSQVFEE